MANCRRVAFSAFVLALLTTVPVWAQSIDIGRVSAVNPAAAGRRPTAPPQVLQIGYNVQQNERITTDAGGRAHLMFVDQSAITVGPNSDIVLDRFVFDPARDTGALAVTAARGALRFIGGRVSKSGDVTITTPVGTAGIRGGVSIVQVIDERSALFVHIYGQSTRIQPRTDCNGQPITITRRGYGVRIPDECSPRQLSEQELNDLLSNFRGSDSTTAEALNQIFTAAGGGPPVTLGIGLPPGGPTNPVVPRVDTRFFDQTPTTTLPPPPPPVIVTLPPPPPPPPPPGGGFGNPCNPCTTF